MAGFLYFVSGLDTQSPRASDLGMVGWAVETSVSACRVSNGPGPSGPGSGPGGLVVVDGRNDSDTVPGYYPDRQAWHRVPGVEGPAVYVGLYTDRPKPTPHDLARTEQRPGHEVTLQDGQRWLVPVAMKQFDTPAGLSLANCLPTVARYNDRGEWQQGAIVSKYARLWEIACEFWDSYMAAASDAGDGDAAADGPVKAIVTYPGLMQAACDALQINYRIGPVEASVLELLDEPAAFRVLKAVVDWPAIDAYLAKKERGLSSRELTLSLFVQGLAPGLWLSLADLWTLRMERPTC